MSEPSTYDKLKAAVDSPEAAAMLARDGEAKRNYALYFHLEIDADSPLRAKDLLAAVEKKLRKIGAEPIAARAVQYEPNKKEQEK